MADLAKYQRARKFLIFGTIFGIAIYALLVFFSAYNLYLREVEDRKQNATLTASAVERVIDADIRGVALSIAATAESITTHRQIIDPAITHELEWIEDYNTVIDQIAVIGRDGFAANRDELLSSGEVDFNERPYLAFHKTTPGDAIFVDGPFTGRLAKNRYMTVSRRVGGPSDDFLGVIVASIDIDAYGASLARLESGKVEEIAVYRDDGTLMLGVPEARAPGATSRPFAVYPEQFDSRDSGVFLAEDPLSDETRYVGFARVGAFPLVVTASSPSRIGASSWDFLIPGLIGSLIVLVGAGALAGLALYGLRRQASFEDEHAKDHGALKKAEGRHRSLLDALPANVALIDSDGTILESNAGWHQFSQAVKSDGRGLDHGSNYLAVCEAAARSGDEDAARVANGLRTILAGGRQRFDMDYPWHSPTEQRWLHLSIAPMELEDRHGAVAMHLDVTARKLTEIALVEERQRLRRLTEEVPGAVFRVTLGADGVVQWTFLSDGCRDLFGISPRDALEGGGLLAKVLSPEQLPAVSAAVEEHLREGEDLDCEFTVRGPGGQVRFVRAVAVVDGSTSRQSDGIFLDVTGEREAMARAAYLSTHDVLTGLVSRTEFLRRLDEALNEPRSGSSDIVVVVVGIDDFSDIGDAYGMETADAVLRAVAERIAAAAGPDALVGRISSERFAILLRSRDVTAPATLAESIITEIGEPFDLPGNTISCTASVGISRPESDTDGATTLVSGAKRALRRAREAGRGTFRFDEANSGLETQARLTIRSGLARALANGEFALHFQPRVRLADAVVTGCEALLRWQHPVFGMQPPAKFIPVAEHSGQIVPIGKWVLKEACRHAKQWLDAGHPDLRIAVNVSAVQVTQSDIVATVEAVLAETGLPAGALELEMTEAVAFDVSLRAQLDRIHALGVSIAIDDFGTGFSSLGALHRFPLDILKIDQSFVRQAPELSADRVVVGTIVDLARGLRLTTVAEGVETIEQALLLHSLGCDEIQGYYIAMPMEAADFVWFLESRADHIRRKLQPLYTSAPQLVGKDDR